MTSSFSQKVERGLDTMLIVYGLIDGHPASTVCEQFIRKQCRIFGHRLAEEVTCRKETHAGVA